MQRATRAPDRGGGSFTVWRISKASRAAFDGEGARLYGGRWNRPGVAVVYTSESLALASLELFVHLDTDLQPDDLVAVSAEVSAALAVETIEAGDLPATWREYPPHEELQALGTAWARRAEKPILSVPSAVVPSERNYLLNPRHRDFAKIRVSGSEPFSFDPRMWR